VAVAGSIDLFVVRSSKLALQRSSSARLRDFATQEIAAHNGLASQLSFAGRRLNLLPSATLRPEHQALLDRLESASRHRASHSVAAGPTTLQRLPSHARGRGET